MNNRLTSPARGATRAAPLARANSLRRILVVEDDEDVRRLSTEALMRHGYQVDAAEDGAVAWDALQSNSYDLLVTDNAMPKVTGIELLQKLRAAGMELPVIMATAAPPDEEFVRHPGLQPVATLRHPYTVAKLLSTVKIILCALDRSREPVASPLTYARPANGRSFADRLLLCGPVPA